MPRSRPLGSTITYSCDICDFKVTNSYIFKRHLHRCYTLHGVASRRSSPRLPQRLKGTEGVRSVDCEDSGRSVSEREDGRSARDDGDTLADLNNDHDMNAAMEEGVCQDDNNDGLSPGAISPQSSSQWSVKDSPMVVLENVEDGVEEDDDNDDEGEDESRIVSLNGENDDIMDVATAERVGKLEEERSFTDSPNSSRAKARFERNYHCEYCSFKTVKSREFLYHLKDNHDEQFNIYECSLCDYASRYNNKLSRHMTVHRKPSLPAGDDVVLDQNINVVPNDEPSENHNMKVKPLKLKRLHVKAPSVFQVTHEPKVKEAKVSPSMGKNVFKMVLAADGSHDYQCRDCLFYASNAISVKRHYSLCHSRLLQCGLCDFNTRSQAEHYEHIITHEGRITYHKCPDCSYVTHAKPTFENHRSHHGSNAPFKCRVCNFAADSESKVKRHMATQHTNKNNDYTDSLRVEVSAGTQVLDDVETGWKEEEEVEGDELMEDFEMHADIEKSETVSESKEPSIMKPRKPANLKYKCPHCLVVCLRRGNLTRHFVARHNYSQKKASISSKTVERQLLKRKPIASSLVSSASRFMKNINPAGLGQESLHCSECSYSAKWPSDLRRHQQVHTLVKRFKCPICTNKYKYLGDLNVHMRRDHLVEPPQQNTFSAEDVVSSEVIKKSSPAIFRCPICALTVNTKAELECHTRQHGDIDKTYQCRLCDYQTYWRGDVGRHLFRHHKIHLSRRALELEDHFIYRPNIRPLTKMPMSMKAEKNVDDAISEHQNPTTPVNTTPELPSAAGKLTFKNVLTSGGPSKGKEGSVSSFTCNRPTCEYRTTTLEKLEIHMAIHENIKIFVCPTCGKRANYKWDVVKHMVKVHKNPGAGTDDVIVLPIEEARETISDYLGQFERKVVDMPMYSCSICDFKSGEKSLISQHLGENHAAETGYVVSSSTVLKVKQELNAQTDEVSNALLSEDNKVSPKFVEPAPEELAKHDRPYACGNCKKAELTLSDIQRHYSYAHPYKELRVIYTPDGTEFDCNTLEIYPGVKKSAAAAQNFLESDESMSHSSSQQTSPLMGRIIRPDSKYSNPKMHGYIKPFKCSVCGLRSNWKWDLKKHLRSKHPHDGGFVIMLSIEEAQMTYGKECSRSHPKCETQVITSPDTGNQIALDDSFSSSGPLTSGGSSSRNKSAGQPPSVGTNFDPRRRQWKCSGCDYITNWRRNMARHMMRRHGDERSRLRVISLHMLNKDEQDAILLERQKRLETMGKVVVDLDEEEECDSYEGGNDFSDQQKQPVWPAGTSSKSHNKSSGDGRMWKCPKCSYHSTLRTHIIIHMQKHELRPFLCGVCNAPFMNRSPLHSHIQKVHQRSDYIKLVKVNIRYDGVIDQSHLGITHQQDLVYQCFLCKLKFKAKSSFVEHLKSTHGVEDNIRDYVSVCSNAPPPSNSAITGSKLFAVNGDGGVAMDGNIIRRKLHHCRLCPYTTQKKNMLSFHMTYHKATPANRIKCKYCPYYVSTMRLLHQHQRKWHSEVKKSDNSNGNAGAQSHPQSMLWDYPQTTPPHSPDKNGGESGGTPRRHKCEKCPYTTNSKNDFYYHKQFHRPKRTAEYKCEFCDYWVTQKRLLKQHMRLHEQENSLQELSPAKSVYSDPGLVYDPVELTEMAALKQSMISAKILPSLSKSPKVSPMKIASRCSTDDKPGYVLKNGLYRKLHKCPKCPYTNTRARNMNLHIMMHGPRESSCPLMRCPYCDYYVGSKGLLSHHMKVHQKQYGDTPENDARKASVGQNDDYDDEGDESDEMMDIQAEQKVDTLLKISRMKRFGCEKCPYASAKRQHFQRHLELHGSRQRYTCQYCDYSVPSSYLLTQHSRLHLMPNQNLLLCQSINNLQHVSEVPADVALASALPPSDSDMSVTISVIHDHLGLYENSIYDPEQRKLYRCDRCPYANVRRDHLLSHLKFHMVSSSLVCPYCDYSAPKQALLTQHIRVHFCPLPELSDWLLENGQTERETSQRNIDMAEALKVAREYQSQSKKKAKGKEGEKEKDSGGNDGKKVEEKENIEDKTTNGPDPFICQYCDREFVTSDKLVKHELQHLIGNQFEMALKVLKTVDKSGKDSKKDKVKIENDKTVGGSDTRTVDDDKAMKDGGGESQDNGKEVQDIEMKDEAPNQHGVKDNADVIDEKCDNIDNVDKEEEEINEKVNDMKNTGDEMLDGLGDGEKIDLKEGEKGEEVQEENGDIEMKEEEDDKSVVEMEMTEKEEKNIVNDTDSQNVSSPHDDKTDKESENEKKDVENDKVEEKMEENSSDMATSKDEEMEGEENIGDKDDDKTEDNQLLGDTGGLDEQRMDGDCQSVGDKHEREGKAEDLESNDRKKDESLDEKEIEEQLKDDGNAEGDVVKDAEKLSNAVEEDNIEPENDKTDDVEEDKIDTNNDNTDVEEDKIDTDNDNTDDVE